MVTIDHENPKIQHAKIILIVSTDADLRKSLKDIIEAESHIGIEATNGEEALTLVNRHNPHLILMATDMPLMDGYEASRKLRSFPEYQQVPIIMLTDNDSDEILERIYDCGAFDFVCVPVRPIILSHRIRTLLKFSTMRGTLSEKEERYRIISTSISDYAYAYRVAHDGSMIKEWSTKAFETITGYAPNELDGDGWSQLIHPDDIPSALNRMHRLLAGEKDVTEFRIQTKSGEIKWLLDHGQPVWDDQLGRVVRIYGAAQDITERKRTEELMRLQTLELQQRNEELDAFAHTVAHDLKNPISGMMGFASLVLNYYDRMTDEKIKEYLQLIMESGYKLKEIINSILLLAGVNRMGQVQLSPLDMHDILKEVKTRLINMIEESQAEINVHTNIPLAIGYGPWVEEIWANYLSNAIKYGGTPPVIEIGGDDPVDGKVRFWIRDNGNGLSEEEQKLVFTPFTRLTQAKIEGHGLGLSVVERIVDRLGGEVGLICEIGKGCVFSFTLPVAEGNDDDEDDA